MKNRLATIAVGVSLAAALLLPGCQGGGNGKIAIGKVDTAILLKDDPGYQSLSIEYLKEQTDIRKTFVDKLKKVKNDESKQKALQKDYIKVQQDFEAKWKKKTVDFIKTRHTSIQDTAAEIAKRKKIDMVVIDSSEYPTVEWGGVDMTKDMALAMSTDQGKQPESTGTPKGE